MAYQSPPFDLQAFLGLTGDHFPEHGPNGGRRPVCFASGLMQVAEIQGLCSVGIPPGVSADQLMTPEGLPSLVAQELELLAGSGIPVFVDQGPRVLVSDTEWRSRLQVFARLALCLGPQLYVVAPDRPGDQGGTLASWLDYRSEIREVANCGAQVLVTIQPGVMTPAELLLEAAEILGPVIPAFKLGGAKATKPILEFVAERRPKKVHLLGQGGREKAQNLIDALWGLSPGLHLSRNMVMARPGLPPGEPVEASARARAWALSRAFECHPVANQFPGGQQIFGQATTRDPAASTDACLGELRAVGREYGLRPKAAWFNF